MKFIHKDAEKVFEYSIDDVFLLPQKFAGNSREDVDLTPADGCGGSNPIVSANMNGVTGKRMAETIARYGGLGILPQDMELMTAERIIRQIKRAPINFDTALTLQEHNTLREAKGIIWKRAHGAIVVISRDRCPVGIFNVNDTQGMDQYATVKAFMSTEPVTLQNRFVNEDAFNLMQRKRISIVPIVDDAGKLEGVLTREDAVRLSLHAPNLDANGRLKVALAVGVNNASAELLTRLKDMGIDLIVLDTAHGHQKRMVDALRISRQTLGKEFPIVAGNVCTAEGTRELLDAGADIVKVNVGPGAMCTTRMQTGFGRPTFSAVKECADEARKTNQHVWADGGVRYPRDVAIYLAAGASRVMIGTLFAGVYESPGDIQFDADGKMYKINYGMASSRAVEERNKHFSAFQQAIRTLYREGVNTAQVYLKPGHESIGAIMDDIISGVRSAYTYGGARNQVEFSEKALIGIQTHQGFHEGTPHGLWDTGYTPMT